MITAASKNPADTDMLKYTPAALYDAIDVAEFQ